MSGDGFLGPRALGVTRELPRPAPPPPGPMPGRWTRYQLGPGGVCAYLNVSGALILHYADRHITTVDLVMPLGASTTPAELAEVTRDTDELCTWLARGGSAGV